MSKSPNLRAIAARACYSIIEKGKSLDACLSNEFEQFELSPENRGFVQEVVYGVCRWYGELDFYAAQLLEKPIRNKDRAVHFLLLVGLYQLKYMQTAEHAAVSETVSAARSLKKEWAKRLLNGCLRRWQREHEALRLSSEQARLKSHPQWLLEQIKNDWQADCSKVIAANNEKPILCLRVNQLQQSRKQYLALLENAGIEASLDRHTEMGIRLAKPIAVSKLPKFEEGAVSVQDTAAQLAAEILKPQSGETILDACSAPGGKAAHLLEASDNRIELHAIDISAKRMLQTKEGLERLKLSARTFTADASVQPSWPLPSDGYDAILVDAPCSGTGVIRRHPDIRHHRRPTDIEALAKTQLAIVSKLWPLLKVGGRLLYMTCSVLKQENELQMEAVTSQLMDAQQVQIEHPHAYSLNYGCQTLPGVHDMDGFYYCLLRKIES